MTKTKIPLLKRSIYFPFSFTITLEKKELTFLFIRELDALGTLKN